MAFKRVLVLICILSMALFEAGCSNSVKPEDVFNVYISDWGKKDYKPMYQMLSEDSKKNITEEDFAERYQNIYDGIGLSSIKITPNYSQKMKPDKQGRVQVPFTVNMETQAGEVKFSYTGTLVSEKRDKKSTWAVIWDAHMIFPQLDDGEKVRFVSESAARGEIFDRNGKKLAENGYALSIGIVPKNIGDDKEGAVEKIAKELGTGADNIEQKLSAKWVKDYMFVPITDISESETEKVSNLSKIPGVQIKKVEERTYPLGQSAAHLTGYVGRITAEELKAHNGDGYAEDDLIGKAGLESVFEKRLRGQNGGEIYITDSDGNKKETIAKREAKDGEDIKVTIDSSIQNSIYGQLQKDSGAAAAIDPKTGQVLALVSSPSYDPNMMVLGMTDQQWSTLSNDPAKPLTNKFSRVYAPGSTFKPVTASIALKKGAIKPEDSISISGLKWHPDDSWGSYYITRVTDTGRPVNLRDALVYSDNIYFAQAALKIGESPFVQEAKNFGIGEKFPFAFPIASSKLLSAADFKNKMQLADTGYGQGEVGVSVLHEAMIYSVFVNGGDLIAPSLEMSGESSAKIWHKGAISPEIAGIIKDDLTAVVEDAHGTAHSAAISGVRIAAKTGTAELGDSAGTENGWVSAFNVDDPRILVTMMIENVQNKGGSHYVVPKVKSVLQQYLK